MTIAEQIEWLTAREDEANQLVSKHLHLDENLAAQWLTVRIYISGLIKQLRKIEK